MTGDRSGSLREGYLRALAGIPSKPSWQITCITGRDGLLCLSDRELSNVGDSEIQIGNRHGRLAGWYIQRDPQSRLNRLNMQDETSPLKHFIFGVPVLNNGKKNRTSGGCSL